MRRLALEMGSKALLINWQETNQIGFAEIVIYGHSELVGCSYFNEI